MQTNGAAINPWRFLTALDGTSEIDRRLLQVTRPDEVQLISHMVAAARVSVLYSFSGNGKSSVVNAGLIPFLTANGYAVFRVRPRPPWSIDRPAQAFKESILRDINLPLLRRSDLDLLRRVKDSLAGASQVEKDQLDGLIARLEEQASLSAQTEQHSEKLRTELKQHVDRPLAEFISLVQKRLEPNTTLAFICDQFEELFVHFGNTPALDEFVAQLGEVWADSSLRVRILFSMREDWVGSLIEFRKTIPDIFRDYFKLKPITRSRAGHVLTLPLEAVGASIEPKAVDAILDDLAASYVRVQQERFSGINLTPSLRDDPYIELPALQVVADRLWATRSRATTPFSLAHYRSLGNHAPAGNGSASPAQVVLDEYLGDLLDGSDGAGDLSAREFRELRLDCLYLLTDRVRHRRALPEGLLLEELKQIRLQSLDLPAVTQPRLTQALMPLERRRLVREDVSRSGDRQYELAHDFAVRSVVASWRQLDRERTATLAVLERERRQTEQKVDVLKHAERRSTRLLQWVPLAGFAALVLAMFASATFGYSALMTGLVVAPFLSILIAALLRGHRPSAILGGAGLVGTAAVVWSGYYAFDGLALLAAALVPVYLWSGHRLSTENDARLPRLFATLWTEYAELLKIAAGVGVAATVEKMGGGGGMTSLLLITTPLVMVSVGGYQIARRGYQAGHAWTGRRVTRTNGEPLSVGRGVLRQVALLAWIGVAVLVGALFSGSFASGTAQNMVMWALLSVAGWISGAAFIAGLDEKQRHIYDRVTGTHVTSDAASTPSPAVSSVESSGDVPRVVKTVLVPAFAIAVAGMALVFFTRPFDEPFFQRMEQMSYMAGFPLYEYVRVTLVAGGGILAISSVGLLFERTRRIASMAVLMTFAMQVLINVFETVGNLYFFGESVFVGAGRTFDALNVVAVTLMVLAVSTTTAERRAKRMDIARVAFSVGLIGGGVMWLTSVVSGALGLGSALAAASFWMAQVASIATGILLLRQFHASRACLVLAAMLALEIIVRVVEGLGQGYFSAAWIPESLLVVIGAATWAVLLAPRPSEAPAAVEAAPA